MSQREVKTVVKEANKKLSSKEIKERVEERFGTSISLGTIRNNLRKLYNKCSELRREEEDIYPGGSRYLWWWLE